MERIHFSAAFHSSSLRLVYIITTQFFALRSSPFLGISKTDPYHSCPPHVGLCFMRACEDGVLVWVQTVWINRLLTFLSPVLYYLLITGDSVYLVVVVVVVFLV